MITHQSLLSLVLRVVKSRLFVLALIIAVILILVGLLAPGFLRWENFRVILVNMAPKAIILGGMVMLMAGGRFDLSIDGVAALSGIVAGKMMLALVDPLLAVLAGLAVGCSVGLLNGFIVEKLNVNPLITTLGTWWGCSGAALGITEAMSPYDFPDSFFTMGRIQVLDINIIVFYALAILLITGIVLKYTKFGYHTFATGGGRQAAQLHGVNILRVGIILYLLVGVLSSFAGLVFAARIGSASPVALNGINLQVIAACVIGGSTLTGGEGSVVGALLGLFLLDTLSNAAIYLGINPYWQKSISGMVLLAAVISDALSKRPSPTGQRRSFITRLFQLRTRE